MTNIVAWSLAAVVMFGPGVGTTWFFVRRRRRHSGLRAAIALYGYLPRHR